MDLIEMVSGTGKGVDITQQCAEERVLWLQLS
jgi:hypothetical protein